MGCRFPGGVTSPGDLWRLVYNASDATGPFPPDRVNEDVKYRGGFIEDAAQFTPGAFGMSPREAELTDPQQRVALQVAAETFQRVGLTRRDLHESSTGVFIGAMAQEYGGAQYKPDEPAHGYGLTGTSPSVISGRIAYHFGLIGPALTIDTACSSSLVAIHQAVRALRDGSCEQALAGGVAVMPTPALFADFAHQGGVAADGRCKAFSAASDGVAWAEGCGLLLLETVEHARANGRPVLAVISGIAINQDGASNGLTAPNGRAQERVVRAALGDAGIEPDQVDLLEAHGTGTPLGDAIEAKALARTYGRARRNQDRAFLGSLKSNIGHAQAAAGVGGVIKVIQAMRHEQMPSTLHVDRPTEQIDWAKSGLELLTSRRTWPTLGGSPRRAAVSSFGISGTNAHIILTEGVPITDADAEWDGLLIAHVSGETEASMCTHASRVLTAIRAAPAQDLPMLTAATRAHSPGKHCVAVIADDADGLIQGLQSICDGNCGAHATKYSSPSLVSVAAASSDPVLVFPGQGAQWSGMIDSLYGTSLLFRKHFDTCADALDRQAGPQWRQALDDSAIQRPDWVQPALFATTVALARYWIDLGIKPRAVVGSSQGEIAAAHIAGVLSLDEAAKVVCRRSALIRGLAPSGGMLWIRAARPEVDGLIGSYAGEVEVAVENANRQTVVAGHPSFLDALQDLLEDEQIENRRIAVDYASHTAAMEVLEQDLLESLVGLHPKKPIIPILSTLTGDWVDARTRFDGAYWYANLRQTVRFRETINRLVDGGEVIFLEVSPHPVMGQALAEILDDADMHGLTVGSLMRDSGGKGQLAVNAATLGATVLNDISTAQEAPPPVMETCHLWAVPTTVTPAKRGESLIDLPDGRQAGTIDVTYDWVEQHQVAGRAIAPGTLMLAALSDLLGPDTAIDELTLQAPVTRDARFATVVIEPHDGDYELTVSVPGKPGSAEGAWVTAAHASASKREKLTMPEPDKNRVSLVLPESDEVSGFYEGLAARGYGYGPAFQGVRSVKTTPTTAVGVVAGPPGLPWAMRSPHPIQLDTLLQVALPLLPKKLMVPYLWRAVTIGRPSQGAVSVRADLIGAETIRLHAEDSSGEIVLKVEELHFAAVEGPDAAVLTELVWNEIQLNEADDEQANSILLLDGLDQLPYRPLVVVETAESKLGPIDLTERVVGLIQQTLERRECVLVLVTRQAFAVDVFDSVKSLFASPLAGLVRTAAAENPGRVRLIDLDDDPRSLKVLDDALASSDDVELAIRRGKALRPRIGVSDVKILELNLKDPGWRIDRGEHPTIEDIGPTADDAAHIPLRWGQVRIGVRATGLNFRDVTVALGMLASEQSMGCEIAGVVIEVGPGVGHLRVGESVFGLAAQSIAPVVVAAAACLRPLPKAWGWSDGAAAVIAGVTAKRSLEIAGVGPGDKVLIHAATGGVGQVLVALAQADGMEVFATAHPDKQHLLRRRGLDAEHCSTSRSTDFEEHFGVEMDAIINCLSGPMIDASLRLLRPGGSFVEIGKTDLRDAGVVGAEHQVEYVAYNVLDETPTDVGRVLDRVIQQLTHAEIDRHAVDVRYARQGISRLRHAQHPGKLVLTVPQELGDLGTCLITGGTSGLGALCAEHLLSTRRASRVILVSRRGLEAPGAKELLERLQKLSGSAEVRTCDISQKDSVVQLVADVQPDSVIHAAGALQDVPIHAMDRRQIRAVMEPKIMGALNLDQATSGLDLKAFVLYSSALGCVGSPGQGNYTAASTFLESLASRRRQEGLTATCINWGLWAEPTGMTSHLSGAAIETLARRTGLRPVPTSVGLAMLDLAVEGPVTSPIAARFDGPEVVGQSRAGEKVGAKPADDDRLFLLKSLAADVLGYSDPEQIDATTPYRDLGFDSLLTIDLRNRIGDRTGRMLKVEQILAAGTLEVLASIVAEPGEGSTPSQAIV